MKSIEGILTFSKGILCKREIIGKSFKATVSGINIELFFPTANENISKAEISEKGFPELLPPTIGKRWIRGDKSIYWGSIMQYPKLHILVEKVAVKISCEDGKEEETTEKVYSTITEWDYAFVCFIELVTKQVLFEEINIPKKQCQLEILYYDNYRSAGTIYGIMHSDDSFASDDIIKQAINFANSGKELFLEYQMLLSAYKARKRKQYRQAILDGCSAMEICLNKYIKKFCAEKDMDPDILLRKYRFLGDKFKLVKQLDANFPNLEYESLIVTPRNNLMHNNMLYPDNNTVCSLLKSVEDFLSHYHTTYY